MKVGEMLSDLKKEELELNRLIDLRKETFWVEEKNNPVVLTKDLTKKIIEKQEQIRLKKLEIQKNNLETKIGDITLAEAILKISDLRKEINNLNDLKKSEDYGFRSLRDDKERKKAQLNQLEIEELIAKKENEKTELDSKIQSSNWK